MTEDPLNTSLKPRVKAQPPHHSNYSNFHAMLFAQNFNTDLIRACLKLQAFELGRKQSKKPTQSLQKKKKTHYHEVFWGWFRKVFYFQPYLGKMNPFWRAYFSDELKPPTRDVFGFTVLRHTQFGWRLQLWFYIAQRFLCQTDRVQPTFRHGSGCGFSEGVMGNEMFLGGFVEWHWTSLSCFSMCFLVDFFSMRTTN